MNVCQMDGGIGPVGQILRRSDSVNRHLREIDRHKNVLNARFFHGQYPELARAASLPLLAKSHPFFVRQLSLGPRYGKINLIIGVRGHKGGIVLLILNGLLVLRFRAETDA